MKSLISIHRRWRSPPSLSSFSYFSLFPLPPSSAAGILRSRGYSLMAQVLDLTAASGETLNGWNATGTLFAPTDPAFKKPDRRRLRHGLPWLPTSRPPVSLLLYHTARTRPLLYADLASRPAGTPIPTFSRRRLCLFLRRAPGGEPCIAESARPTAPCVRFRDPDLYRDGDIAVHGVDGVLDPTAVSPCRADTWHDSAPFDARVRSLGRKGYAGGGGDGSTAGQAGEADGRHRFRAHGLCSCRRIRSPRSPAPLPSARPRAALAGIVDRTHGPWGGDRHRIG